MMLLVSAEGLIDNVSKVAEIICCYFKVPRNNNKLIYYENVYLALLTIFVNYSFFCKYLQARTGLNSSLSLPHLSKFSVLS